jgi:hypothetical protein
MDDLEIYSQINVAEWPSKRAHRILVRDVFKRIQHRTQGQRVIECAVTTRRRVQESDGAIDRIPPVLEILVLPDPPCAVDLSVVKVESLLELTIILGNYEM